MFANLVETKRAALMHGMTNPVSSEIFSLLAADTGLLCHLIGLDARGFAEESLMTGAVLES